MARVTIVPIDVPSAYADTSVAGTWTASDASLKNQCVLTGREILIARNAGVTSRAITITSAADEMGRTNDVTHTLGSGAYRIFPFFKPDGWLQADGYLYFEAAHAEVEWMILRLPAA
jgi:hypothetical protein